MSRAPSRPTGRGCWGGGGPAPRGGRGALALFRLAGGPPWCAGSAHLCSESERSSFSVGRLSSFPTVRQDNLRGRRFNLQLLSVSSWGEGRAETTRLPRAGRRLPPMPCNVAQVLVSGPEWGFPTQHCPHWAGGGAGPCIAGSLAASLVSTHLVSVCLHPHCDSQHTYLQSLPNVPWAAK